MGLRTTLSCQAKLLAGSRGTSPWKIGFPCMSIFPCRSRSTRAHITVTARIDIPACTEKHLWVAAICFLLSLLTRAPHCTGKATRLAHQPCTARSTGACPLMGATRQPWENQNLVPNCCAKWHKCRRRLRCVAGCDTLPGAHSPHLSRAVSASPVRCCFPQTRVGEAGLC